MKKALIIYHSKTGVTRMLGKEIHAYVSSLGIEAKSYSINDFEPADAAGADYVLLGCWTSGLFIVLQHPEAAWIEFSRRLPDLGGKKILLFTTYKLATGSMFGGMQKRLTAHNAEAGLRLKSRDGRLSDDMKQQLKRFIESVQQ